MVRTTVILLIALAAGCTSPPSSSAVAPVVATQRPIRTATSEGLKLPAGACTREGYEQFFETFVRRRTQRAALALPGAPLASFDIAMRDYSWVQQSDENTLLDIDETRSGDTFVVKARPVERDENDEITKVLGPARTYRFRYSEGCWKFASSN